MIGAGGSGSLTSPRERAVCPSPFVIPNPRLTPDSTSALRLYIDSIMPGIFIPVPAGHSEAAYGDIDGIIIAAIIGFIGA